MNTLITKKEVKRMENKQVKKDLKKLRLDTEKWFKKMDKLTRGASKRKRR